MNFLSLFEDVLFLTGLGLVAAGAWMLSPAASCIFFGAAAVAAAMGMTWRKGRNQSEK
ncbi:MAG: hypothetical protein ACE15F_11750 [bacterium]